MSEGIQTVKAVPRLPGRCSDAHKGDFGRVLVVGGSRGMIGAPSLTANAALRGGAGLVTLAVPETVQLAAAGLCPCATSIPLACAASGELSGKSVRQVSSAAIRCDVLAVGPGVGVSAGAGRLVRAVLVGDRPVVLDADGLNNLARIEHWPGIVRCPMVLTPHPGELATLTGQPIDKIQSDRQGAAVAAAREWAGPDAPSATLRVVVLKGAGTVVASASRIYVNDTGNPGMATGGTGDVLTGLIAALIGQGLGPFEAACLGVHVHGLAGDLAAEKLGQASMIASDLLDFIPAALGGFVSP